LWKLQEKEKGLVFGEEGENVSRVSKSVGRWVCEWPSWLVHSHTNAGRTLTVADLGLILPNVSISTPRLQYTNYIASSTNGSTNNEYLLTVNTLIANQQQHDSGNNSNCNVEYWPKDRPLPYPRWLELQERQDENGNTCGGGVRGEDVGHITKIHSASAIITSTNHHQPYRNINSASIIKTVNNGNGGGSVVHFSDVIKYEQFAGVIELVSQQTVAAHKYNTVDNFIR